MHEPVARLIQLLTYPDPSVYHRDNRPHRFTGPPVTSKLAEKALNLVSGMATNLSAAAYFAAHPAIGTLLFGAAAIVVAAEGLLQGRGEEQARKDLQPRLTELFAKHGTLAKAVSALAVDEDMQELVSRQRIALLLRVTRKQSHDLKNRLAENLELIAYVGRWIETWCVEQKERTDQLDGLLEETSQALRIQLDRVESKVDDGFARGHAADEKTHDGLAEVKAILLGQRDGIVIDADLDAAGARLRTGAFAEALALLERLRSRSWSGMSDRQRFRILANLGHAYEGKDDFTRAAQLYMEAKEFQPTDPKGKCLECAALTYLNDANAADFAERLRREYPENGLAQSLWLRHQPVGVPFDELERAIPELLRGDPDVAVALSRKAAEGRHYEVAERYARLALKAVPDNPKLQMYLGELLVEAEPARMSWTSEDVPMPHRPDVLQEAIHFLSQAIQSFSGAGPQTLSATRRARGIAYTLLGQSEKADRDFSLAYDVAPDDPAVSVDYAMTQADQGPVGVERAIDALAAVIGKGQGVADLQFAGLLIARNRTDDRSRAVQVLRGSLAAARDWPEHLSIRTVGTLIEALCLLKDQPGAFLELERLPTAFVPTCVCRALEATIHWSAGDIALATETARASWELINPATSAFTKRIVAVHLMSFGLFSESLALWKDIVKPTAVTRDTLRLLESASNCDDHAVILDFCRSLRLNGVYDPACLDRETATLGRYHAFDEAIAILQQYVLANPDDDAFAKIARVRLSGIGVELQRPELMETRIDRLPDVQTVSARLGAAVVQILGHSDDPFKGVEYAYTLVRRHFDDPDAHQSLIRAFLFGTTARPVVPTSEFVVPGFAAVFKTPNDLGGAGYVIEDSPTPPPNFHRDELAPEDPRAVQLRSLRKDDDFFLRKGSIQDLKAPIAEVIHKTVYRVRDSVLQLERRLGSDFILRIQLPTAEDGSMDFSAVFRSVDRRAEYIASVEQVVREQRLPVAALAAAVGTSILETVEHVAGRSDLKIWSSRGTDDEWAGALEQLRAAKRIVLAPSAIATLKVTGVFRLLHDLPFSLILSHGAHAEIRRLYSEMMARSEEGGVMAKIDDRHVFIANDPTQIEARRQELRELLTWLEKNCQTADGTPLAYVPISEREILIDRLGAPCAESMALASDGQSLLWDDELAIGDLGRQSMEVKRIWTQLVLVWLMQANCLPLEHYHRATIDLLRFGYHFTRFSAATIIHALNVSHWDFHNDGVNVCLSGLLDTDASADSVTRVALETLLGGWPAAPSNGAKLALVKNLLNTLDRRVGGRDIVRVMLAGVQNISRQLDLPHHVYWFLRNWLLTGSINDYSWQILGPKRSWLDQER